MSNKSKKTYDIKFVTYRKEPTGEVDQYGRNIYHTTSKNPGVIKGKDWKTLKHEAVQAAKRKNGVYANFEDKLTVRKRKVLRSTTKVFDDGTREVTYYSGK